MGDAETLDDFKAPRWGSPPDALTLARDEVHVWRARLKAPNSELERMTAALSRAERKSLEKLAEPKPFVAHRHLVRALVGRYTGREPSRLRLREDAEGRLSLAGRRAPSFDVAVSGRRALVAVSAGPRVALALDEVPREEAEIAARMREVPTREARQLEFLSAGHRGSAVVGYQVERRALARLGVDGDGARPARVERLKMGGRYVAALAAEGWDWSPSFWRFLGPGEDEDDEDGID